MLLSLSLVKEALRWWADMRFLYIRVAFTCICERLVWRFLYTSSAAFINYCAFQKQANSDVQTPTDPLAFFAAVDIISGPVREQNLTLTGSKSHGKVIP